jgi:hypothetical protein
MSINNNNDNILILLNDFIIDIINKRKLFSDNEYENIKKINKTCEFDNENDCQTTIKNKLDIQHYIFYFLLEFIKLNISDNNNDNDNNDNDNNDNN